jgi:DNA-binding IclR family transcriptional regulator
MTQLSYDVLTPRRLVKRSPFSTLQDPGQLGDFPKSAIRALQILELLATSKRPLRAVEIGTPLGLSPSSGSQLLKAMMDWGYLIFDPITKRYAPSPRISHLGAQVSFDYFGPGVLDALMQAAQRACDLPVLLSVSQGSFMQVIDVHSMPQPSLGPPQPGRMQEFPLTKILGLHVPLFGSSCGAAWLSAQDEATVRAAIKLCRHDLGQDAHEVNFIFDRLAEIRGQGYAYGGFRADIASRGLSIALPPSNGIILVLSTVGHRDLMDRKRDEIAEALKAIVREHLRDHLSAGASGRGRGIDACLSPVPPPGLRS